MRFQVVSNKPLNYAVKAVLCAQVYEIRIVKWNECHYWIHLHVLDVLLRYCKA